MKLYNLLTPEEITAIKKLDIRNCHINHVTVEELAELGANISITHSTDLGDDKAVNALSELIERMNKNNGA